MKIISIDVGIKNLSYCLFEVDDDKNSNILKWEIVDLSSQSAPKKCTEINKPKIIKSKSKKTSLMNNSTPCKSLAKYTKNDKYFCMKHAKQSEYILPSTQTKQSFINKQKVAELMLLVEKHGIKLSEASKQNGKHTRSELISSISSFLLEKCLCFVDKQNANDVDLINVAKNIVYKFDNIYDYLELDAVIIENQLANRMQTIQGMLAQLFVVKNSNIIVEFISPANKLKGENCSTYSQRKKQAVQLCLSTITSNPNLNKWEEYFKEHKKKDDLADSFLQGMWYISQKK